MLRRYVIWCVRNCLSWKNQSRRACEFPQLNTSLTVGQLDKITVSNMALTRIYGEVVV